MAQLFISHVAEDSGVALALSTALKGVGYSTWIYEHDSHPGESYLTQVAEAMQQCDAVLVLLSPKSLASNEVDIEVVDAHKSGKRLIPLLLSGLRYEQFQQQRREWDIAMKGAVAIPVPPESPALITSTV